MSGHLDRQAYSLIWRLGRQSLGQTLRVITQLLQRQDRARSIDTGTKSRWQGLAAPNALEQHPAVRQYRRLVWLGWHIDYAQTPEVYAPGALVVLKRGRRFRTICVDNR